MPRIGEYLALYQAGPFIETSEQRAQIEAEAILAETEANDHATATATVEDPVRENEVIGAQNMFLTVFRPSTTP